MRVNSFVRFVCLLATVAAIALWRLYPPRADWSFGAIAMLAALALTAELMGFLLPRGASGSISFIPYMTSVLLVPNFAALGAIVGSRAVVEIVRARGPLKIAFNTAQLLLTYSVAIGTYVLLGGVSLFALQKMSVAEVTITIGIPMLVAYVITFALNTLLVS